MSLLELENVWVSYPGGAAVIKDFSLTMGEGEMVAILGANGAGKTTLMRAISGLLPIKSGALRLAGRDISRDKPSRRVEQGIVHIPEGRQMLAGLSVAENLQIGAYVKRRQPGQIADSLEQVYRMFPILDERRRQMAGSLSGGQQQMLAIGRALMAQPRILLCDEPSLGLAPLVVSEIFEIIGRLRDGGVPVLLVEQNVKKALAYADRVTVLKRGSIVAEGRPNTILEDPALASAYLGA